jgi:hypothetical protein
MARIIMSHFITHKTRSGMKLGEIVITDDDKKELQGLPRDWAKNIMNRIIWGSKDGFEGTLPVTKAKEF